MKKYNVTHFIAVEVTIQIDAESEAEALEESWEYAHLGSYVGNGGYDKIVGVSDSNVSIFPMEVTLGEYHDEYKAKVELAE